MVIIDAMISDDAIQAEIQKINDTIVASGEVLRRDDWGKRKMAYQIN
ncbi:MAG: 30S ribosomal protein S6, partial [Fibrobacteraceae bacterium]|nr:30S ribosomal protein S6 [Fibrobacteraceae bacterium]